MQPQKTPIQAHEESFTESETEHADSIEGSFVGDINIMSAHNLPQKDIHKSKHRKKSDSFNIQPRHENDYTEYTFNHNQQKDTYRSTFISPIRMSDRMKYDHYGEDPKSNNLIYRTPDKKCLKRRKSLLGKSEPPNKRRVEDLETLIKLQKHNIESIGPQFFEDDYKKVWYKRTDDDATKGMMIKQIIFMCVRAAIIITEYILGKVGHSLAVISDASHLTVDLCGFQFTFVGVWISTFKPNESYSYGFHRSEVLNSLISILILVTTCSFLLFDAVKRLIFPPQKIMSIYMLYAAIIGVISNFLLLNLLKNNPFKKEETVEEKQQKVIVEQIDLETDGSGTKKPMQRFSSLGEMIIDVEKIQSTAILNQEQQHPSNCNIKEEQIKCLKEYNKNQYKSEKVIDEESELIKRKDSPSQDLEKPRNSTPLLKVVNPIVKSHEMHKIKNVSNIQSKDKTIIKTAIAISLLNMLNCLNIIIGYTLITIDDRQKWVNPVCTIIFVFIVLNYIGAVFIDAVRILMNAVPENFDLDRFVNDLTQIEGIEEICNQHVWTVVRGKILSSMHVKVSDEYDYYKIEDFMLQSTTVLCRKYGIYHSTIQIEIKDKKDGKYYIDLGNDVHY